MHWAPWVEIIKCSCDDEGFLNFSVYHNEKTKMLTIHADDFRKGFKLNMDFLGEEGQSIIQPLIGTVCREDFKNTKQE